MLQEEHKKARRQAADVASQNQARQTQNEKIAELLRGTTQQQIAESDPRKWWAWWQAYMDRNPDERLKVLRSGFGESLLRAPPSSLHHRTLVWTNLGRRRIDEIAVGDLVLSQHPVSGELAYQPVIGVAKTSAPTWRIDFEHTSLLGTAGLSIWRNGRGWWLARDLDSGDDVHGVRGPMRVQGNQEMPELPTLHLAVADFHTFFVGHEGIVVHDVSPVRPVTNPLPGLTIE